MRELLINQRKRAEQAEGEARLSKKLIKGLEKALMALYQVTICANCKLCEQHAATAAATTKEASRG